MSNIVERAKHSLIDVDSDCTIHGVCTWLAHDGHQVVHYCDDQCPENCGMDGEETGEWCNGPLQLRSDPQ